MKRRCFDMQKLPKKPKPLHKSSEKPISKWASGSFYFLKAEAALGQP